VILVPEKKEEIAKWTPPSV
jgi:hypothetical protein